MTENLTAASRGVAGVVEVACDYDKLGPNVADYLGAVALLPFAERRELLRRFKAERGVSALVDAFASFVGLANSVVVNNRECVEMLGWSNGETHPDAGPGPNLPTIFGALYGVGVASLAGDAAMCNGCAYRRGTPANQSPITTTDAIWCVDDHDRFMCHERGLTDNGEPTLTCIGFAAATAKTHTRSASVSVPDSTEGERAR